jgi:16S rRNA (cytidine1402-2'-O)-methyltransferase
MTGAIHDKILFIFAKTDYTMKTPTKKPITTKSMMPTRSSGCLYIVATPIGNSQDISLRALQVLQSVQWIAAEDTRHTKKLLQIHHIDRPLVALHEHNETHRTTQILHYLEQGESVALVSDAGTPLISDPGYYLVKAAHAAGFKVSPIPGSCAAISALCASGLPSDRFTFVGFLPHRGAKRRHVLQELAHTPHTLIFFEAPHRVLQFFADCLHAFGPDVPLTVARELTKIHEQFYCDLPQSLQQHFEENPEELQGEFVILIPPQPNQLPSTLSNNVLLTELLSHLPLKTAVQITAKVTGQSKNTLYEQALLYSSSRQTH